MVGVKQHTNTFIEEEKNSKILKLDKADLTKIQPQGGMTFKESYIHRGVGDEVCVHVWDYPSNVNLLWLDNVMGVYDVTVVADVTTMNEDETISAINKSMVE